MDEQARVIGAEAAISSVLEPPRRRFFSRRRKPIGAPLRNCENCGAPLAGPFCAQCGQHAVDYRRSLWRVLLDAADSFLSWDAKILGTLGVLLTRPWKLTNDFNAGRRVRYVHPLRLYLLASIVFFLLAKLIHFNPADAVQFDMKDRAQVDAALAKLAAPGIGLSDDERAKLEDARARLAAASGTTSDDDRKRMQDALSTLIRASMKEKLKRSDRAKVNAALERFAQIPTPSDDSKTKETPAPAENLPSPSPSTIPATPTETASPQNASGGEIERQRKNQFETWMETRIKEKIGSGGTKSQLFLATLRDNIPTMMLCCIPLFAFVLKVLYLRQRRFYVEHLIYALHIHTFAYLAVVVITLLAMAAARWLPESFGAVIGVLATAAFVQVLLSIRAVYRQGWFFSMLKFFLGGTAYLVILVLGVGATALITLLLPG